MVDTLLGFSVFSGLKVRVVRTSLANTMLSSNSLSTTTTGLDRRTSFVLEGYFVSFYGLVNKIFVSISRDRIKGTGCQLIQVNIYRG
jgi:hypothetical protein